MFGYLSERNFMRHELNVVTTDQEKRLMQECMDVENDSDEVLFDKEYKFDDGIRVALRIVNSRSDSKWTEAILFSPEGAELCVSECDDNLFGEYHFYLQDDEYVVFVK
jgi:hypothetical protein